jgi:3-methyladenine DNA glycosylase AlkD
VERRVTRKKALASKAAPHDVEDVLAALKAKATQRTRDGMARYGIPADHAWGVTVAHIRQLAKDLGHDHELAAALWASGVYEARMLAAFVDDPARVTVAQMDRWCRDFDNWAVCDTVCFHLFDRTPHAFGRIARWAGHRDEFVKRAAFALLASLGVHDKRSSDEAFAACLPLIEQAARDERHLVKKGVSWALRVVGRRSARLHAASVELAQRLASAPEAAPRWVGKDSLRDLSRPAVVRRLGTQRRIRTAG